MHDDLVSIYWHSAERQIALELARLMWLMFSTLAKMHVGTDEKH